jgi:predicted DNA-binding transcriptional regulator YafY
MYHPTTRVLTVLELLQTYRRLSGRELAERLEVAPRTLRRYITMLQDLGLPIEADRGRHGGYRLRPGFKLPPLMFTDDEALALALGLLAARRLGLAAVAPAVEGALAKVERVLPPAVREQVQAMHETVSLSFPPPIGTPAGETVAALSRAARERRRVWLRYRGWHAEETERTIDPYGVVYQEGRWFAVGYCHLREGLRVFRLDRVDHIALRDETFTQPADFDCVAYLQRALASTPGTWEVEVLLQITLQEARMCVPPVLATLDQTAEGVVLRCHVQHLAWFAHFLSGLGCPLVIRRPGELRDELLKLAAATVRLAEAAAPEQPSLGSRTEGPGPAHSGRGQADANEAPIARDKDVEDRG